MTLGVSWYWYWDGYVRWLESRHGVGGSISVRDAAEASRWVDLVADEAFGAEKNLDVCSAIAYINERLGGVESLMDSKIAALSRHVEWEDDGQPVLVETKYSKEADLLRSRLEAKMACVSRVLDAYRGGELGAAESLSARPMVMADALRLGSRAMRIGTVTALSDACGKMPNVDFGRPVDLINPLDGHYYLECVAGFLELWV